MKDFKKDFKKGGFGGGQRSGDGFSKGSFNKGGFRGAPKRDFSAPVELHQATCAHCHKPCEVPFRPNGKKPVFCKDCFASNRPDAPAQGHAQPRTDDLKHQIEELTAKIDTLTRMIKAQASKK